MVELPEAGMGIESGRPSMIGEGHPPAAESKPLRLRISFIEGRPLIGQDMNGRPVSTIMPFPSNVGSVSGSCPAAACVIELKTR